MSEGCRSGAGSRDRILQAGGGLRVAGSLPSRLEVKRLKKPKLFPGRKLEAGAWEGLLTGTRSAVSEGP